jgi:hypothetical protein
MRRKARKRRALFPMVPSGAAGYKKMVFSAAGSGAGEGVISRRGKKWCQMRSVDQPCSDQDALSGELHGKGNMSAYIPGMNSYPMCEKIASVLLKIKCPIYRLENSEGATSFLGLLLHLLWENGFTS